MSELPDTENLLLEREDGWLRIWLNRPESKNALTDAMVRELADVLDVVQDDPGIRGISIRGKGDVFCAGGDLKAFKAVFQGGDLDADEIKAASRTAGELFGQINAMPQVVLMLVDGAAVAGGLGIVCTGDVVAVTESAKFSLTETTLGIPPAQIAPYIVQRLGLNTARRLMLTAARFDGVEAGQLGLADFVVADAAGLDDIEETVREQVMRCAPGANAITKDLVLATTKLDSDAIIDIASHAFAQCMLSDEGREGISAFLGKRKPRWNA